MPAWMTGINRVVERQQVRPEQFPPGYVEYSNADQILSITGFFFGLALLTVLLRMYVRIFMLKVFGIDDWLIVIAMGLAATVFAFFVILTHYGLGKHMMVILMDPVAYVKFNRIIFFHAIFIMVAISCTKISIAVFLLRLSTKRGYKRFLYGAIAFLILFTLGCGLSLIFQCFPIYAAWDSKLRPPPYGTGHANCYNFTVFRNLGLFNSIVNILTDVLFATLPIPLIWQLQLNRRTKLSLIVILSLGYFASAAAIVKAISQWNVLFDPDWSTHDTFNVWNYIELTIGIVAASLGTLKPLFKWFLETATAFTGASAAGSGRKRFGYGYGSAYTYKRNSSLGYLKTDEASSRSIGLQSMGRSAGADSPSSPKSPYNVRVTGMGGRKGDEEEGWGVDRKTSDDSILPLQRPRPVNGGIMMTKEVRIS